MMYSLSIGSLTHIHSIVREDKVQTTREEWTREQPGLGTEVTLTVLTDM